MVHRSEPWRPIGQLISIETLDVPTFKDVITSPNGAYWFRTFNQQEAMRLIFHAEKDHAVQVAFTDVRALTDAKWVNEKLIFVRVWLGRIAAHDLVFDTENEQVVFSQSVLDGRQAYEQYRQGCKTLGGCECAKPDSSSVPEPQARNE